jgi:hypothetical protein
VTDAAIVVLAEAYVIGKLHRERKIEPWLEI